VAGVTIKTSMAYTVKQIAQLTGVTVRTLHHYDEIGLLTSPVIGANGYRYYDERSVLRLQSILFYRELDFPLEAIKALLDQPGLDPITALREQRAALEKKLGRLHRLIATIDQTIHHLNGEKTMSTKQLFAAFTPEEEKHYADEAAKRWDAKTVRASQKSTPPAHRRERRASPTRVTRSTPGLSRRSRTARPRPKRRRSCSAGGSTSSISGRRPTRNASASPPHTAMTRRFGKTSPPSIPSSPPSWPRRCANMWRGSSNNRQVA